LYNGQTISGSQIDADSWSFVIGGEKFMLLKRDLVVGMSEHIEILEADSLRLEKIIAAKDHLLAGFEAYEKSADEHIEVQKELVATSDSLYAGYKNLYHDLKQIMGVSTFALNPGLGLIYDGRWKFTLALGVDYRSWTGQFQFGDHCGGLILGIRLPIF